MPKSHFFMLFLLSEFGSAFYFMDPNPTAAKAGLAIINFRRKFAMHPEDVRKKRKEKK